tara:strand:+ start:101 stop:319 length:219 start_codon:yes stop_codon:yes gene_type:complete
MWRKLFIKHLVETNQVLKIMYHKHGYYPILNLPEKLETKEEIISFGSEIKDAIRFPEYAYLKNNKQIKEKYK